MTMIVVGSGASHLTKEIERIIGKLASVEITKFPDGEKYVRVLSAGDDITVVQSTYKPQDENIIEALLLGDALRERGFKRLRLLVPYLAYSRQDRVAHEGEPVSIRAVLKALGIYYDEIYVVDVHNPETLRFFPGKAVNVSPARAIAEYFAEKLGEGIVLAPDRGARARAEAVAKRLGLEHSHFEKHRVSPTEVEIRPVDIDVNGKNVLIVDDIISTGGTVMKVAAILRRMGAGKIFVGVTHGVFAEGAVGRVSKAVDELAVTNTIPTPVSRINIVPDLLRLRR